VVAEGAGVGVQHGDGAGRAAQVAVVLAEGSQGLPWAARLAQRSVLPLSSLPPVILMPGHRPSQEVKCMTEGKRDMSAPISETTTRWSRRCRRCGCPRCESSGRGSVPKSAPLDEERRTRRGLDQQKSVQTARASTDLRVQS
jgi:hypothetical protein